MAKRCSRGLRLGALLVTTEQLSQMLNRSALEVSPRITAKELRLPVQVIEECLDFIERMDLRETWVTQLVDRALSAYWPECERGRTLPRARFVAFRGPDGKTDRAMYRDYLDDLEWVVGRRLDTANERREARAEIDALSR